jgi:hypothetical protein
VRLVDDDRVGPGQQLPKAQILERQIREQQVVVDDHDLGGLRAATRLDHEATVDVLALAAEAILDGRRDLRA